MALAFTANVHGQNVGIGVVNPQSKLSVNGATSSGGLAIGDATYTSTAGTVAPANGALIEGNVGIGITAPQVPLHVDGQKPPTQSFRRGIAGWPRSRLKWKP
jgi:hypothetical protein